MRCEIDSDRLKWDIEAVGGWRSGSSLSGPTVLAVQAEEQLVNLETKVPVTLSTGLEHGHSRTQTS